MAAPHVLLIADPPAGPRVRDHLDGFTTVRLITAREFHGVPHGTRWVLVMNAEGDGGHIFHEARKVGATPLSIPTGWAHVQEKLMRTGFFRDLLKNATVVAVQVEVAKPLKQRPFSVLANREAPPPAPPAEVAEAPAPPPEPEPVPPEPEIAEPVAPLSKEEEPMLVHTSQPLASTDPTATVTGTMTPEDRERGRVLALESRATRLRAKREILRLVFDRNPNATIREALDALRTMSPDGRGTGSDDVAEVRNEVRLKRGLPLIEGTGSSPQNPQAPRREPERASTTPPPTPVPDALLALPTTMTYTLPQDVEAAVRLLREALETSKQVATFKLDFTVGEKAKIRWRPIIEADTEV